MKNTQMVLAIVLLLFIIGIFISKGIACIILEGAKFRAYEGQRVGVVLPDPGEETAQTPPSSEGVISYPTISFRNGSFLWVYGDTFMSGSYECNSGKLTAHSSTDMPIKAQPIPLTGILIWNGERYQNISQIFGALLILVIGILIMALIRARLL